MKAVLLCHSFVEGVRLKLKLLCKTELQGGKGGGERQDIFHPLVQYPKGCKGQLWSIFWVSEVGTGSQTAHSADFLGCKQGAELELEKPRLELVPYGMPVLQVKD